jgi:hypothetical protein
MEAVFKEILKFKRNPMVEIWYVSTDKVHPIKNGRLDIMYGSTLACRQKIELPLTEVTARYAMGRWDYLYGGGWTDHSIIPLSNAKVWY